MYLYSDPAREGDPCALPDCAVFYIGRKEEEEEEEEGWYWWSCFPGCLPDSDPIGPFATEEEAIANAQG